jgi:hypothetical protein
MGILDNFENAWDIDSQLESKPMPSIDNMGRSTSAWQEGIAVYNPVTLKLFLEACCKDGNCKHE